MYHDYMTGSPISSDDAEFIAEMRGEFLENVIAEIEACEGCLMAFEKSGDESQVTEYKRLVHSMKGGGRMVALNDFSNHVHNLEGVLTRCSQQGRIKDFVVFALPVLDQLKAFVVAMRDEGDFEGESARLGEMISRFQ